MGSALGEGAGRQVDRRRPPHALQPRDQAEQREEASARRRAPPRHSQSRGGRQPALHQRAPRKLGSAAARLPRGGHQRQNGRTLVTGRGLGRARKHGRSGDLSAGGRRRSSDAAAQHRRAGRPGERSVRHRGARPSTARGRRS